jgi:hypothetical protein
MHPGGQILLILAGTGYYQERGKPIQIVHKGDVIKCLPGVEHWHDASPTAGFTYLATTPTQKGKTVWLEPVTGELSTAKNHTGNVWLKELDRGDSTFDYAIAVATGTQLDQESVLSSSIKICA